MASAHRVRKRVLIGIAALLVVLTIAGALYVSDCYRALPYSVPTMANGSAIPVAKYGSFTVYGDSTHGTGLIFYPGGKVETDAYAPLLYGLAQRGICCVATDMPLHLAVLNPNAADDIIRQITSIDKWFICGHSLGGAMASKYASAHQNAISGLILLAAYPTEPFSASYPVLSLYGSNDGVLNRVKYDAAKPLVPAMQEIVLEGGSHAQFGNYGTQKGDGIPEISAEAQWAATIDAIESFCKSAIDR